MRITILLLQLIFSFAAVYSQDKDIAGLTGSLHEIKAAILTDKPDRKIDFNTAISGSIDFGPICNVDKFLPPDQTDAARYTSKPAKRWGHQLIYDEANTRVLLYGGSHGDTVLKDLWEWDGSQWKELTQDGTPAINKGVFVYDAYRKTSVVFGGADSGGENSGDTWEWNGRVWKELKIKGPAARVHSSGVYDRKNKIILLFGGFGLSHMLNDTWAFDGEAWKQVNADGPADRLPLAMMYNETNETITMITDWLKADTLTRKPTNEIWEWTGSAWKNLEIPVPPIIGLQAFASHGKDDILLYDGNKGITWNYHGGKWQTVSKSGPGIRAGHTMVYDKKRMKIVLFGGGMADTNERYNDTWEWDGKQWEKIK